MYDVIICGGGPAGVAAAIAAAENGERTLLVEANSELGGTGTAGGVSHWLGGRSADCREFVVKGIFQRLVTQAVQEGIAIAPQPSKDGFSPFGWDGNSYLTAGIPFNRFRMAELLDRSVLNAGAEILFCTRVIDCEVKGDRIISVTLHNKSGVFTGRAKRFIDATGDADLAALAGVPFVVGEDEEEHGCAPASLEFHVSRVDSAALKRYIDEHHSPRFLKEIQDLKQRGIWKFPFDRLITVQMPQPDCFLVNTPRLVGVNALDGKSVTDGLIEGRRMILELFDLLKRFFPGFANAEIAGVASMLGIRESRRIQGRITLTAEDIIQGRNFPDTIGFCCYGWDLPDPKHPSYQPMAEKNIPIHNDRIPIPFRIMEPRNITNLLVPGRAVSVERAVLGPIRVMASCMLMGEAAGLNNSPIRRFADLSAQERDGSPLTPR